MSYNNISKKITPNKILGKGSEGIVIISNNKKYTIKIYNKNINELYRYKNIINYLYNKKIKVPKTIYKSYLIRNCKHSFKKYITENLSNIFLDNKLCEVMKKYDNTLKNFIKELNNIDKTVKNNILYSLYKQGILTLLWLYINKGIIHNDITLNNFFILKTKTKSFKIKIYNDNYNVKLYGYYLIIADFGYATCIDITEFKNISFKEIDNIYYYYNPLYDIIRFNNIFNNKKFIKNINQKEIINNIKLNELYNNIIQLYIEKKLTKTFCTKYKKEFYKYIKKNITSYF
jgi:hypothetical protein